MDALKELLPVFGTNPYVRALGVVALSLLLAKIAEWILRKVFPRITKHTKSHLDDQILRLLRSPVLYSFLLAGAGVALSIVRPQEPYYGWLTALLRTAAVLIWLLFGIRVSRVILSTMAGGKRDFGLVQPATLPLFDNAVKVILIGVASYFLLVSWNVNITGWLASAGILGIAVGFAAKDTLGNLIAGVSILADAPYKVGDYIVLDGAQRGQVTHIGIRSTRILTRDDIEITIPNSIIASSTVVNESGGPSQKNRIRIRVGVAYGSDIDLVRQVLLETAAAAEHLCKDPEPRVRFRDFGDSGLNFDLLCWIEDPADRGRITDALNSSVYKAFGRAGIEIPFPKRDVYIKGVPESVSTFTEKPRA